MAYQLATLAKRFDLVLCGVAFPSAILMYFVQKLTGTRYVIYSHGEDATCVRGSRPKTKLLELALKKASVVMVNSNFTRREIASLIGPSENVHWLPPSISPSAYQDVSPEQVQQLRTKHDLNDKTVILTVARLVPRKGHDMIIRSLPELMNRISNIHYVVVGQGDITELSELAASLGVQDRVSFIGYVPEEDLPRFYHLCDAYAMVSRWDAQTQEVEGFGFVYLEAGASGKPCVAGSEGGAEDAVTDGVTGFIVNPSSPSEICDAISKLILVPGLAAEMGAAGKKRVDEQFDKTRVLQRLEALLELSAAV